MAGIDQSTLWKFANMILNKSKAQPTTRECATFLRTDPDGTQWVRLPSSNDETPVNGRTLATAKAGDMVEWSIDNGRLSITGNSTSPSVGRDYVGQEVSVVTERVDAVKADIIETNELLATKATITELEAESARIDELEADHVSVSDFQAEQASIDSLQAATADIDTIRANSAKVQNLTAAQLEADHAKVGQLDVSQIAADHATIGNLDTTYMHANMSNSDVAWIQNGTIRDGAIVSAMINDVSANKLTAGTINGSVINVTNLNADNITAGTINGQRIGQGSLSLDKLSEDVYTESEVNDIVDDLNDRIDGAIETHTGTSVPTLNNQPASSWNTTALKNEHVGDVYYVVNSQSQQNGYCYRFTKSGSTYSWQLIKDSDVTAALSRLSTAEGKITSIESFDSTVSSFMTNTDSELTSVKSRATSLETRMTNAEGDISEKVNTSTFNTLSQTVDENSASITSMGTVISNNGLTSSTNITNTVNTVSQTATGNSSKITQLTTTLGTNADGTTKTGDVMHRTSAVEQDITSFRTTVAETYATNTTVGGLATRVSTAESNITQNANNIALKVSESDVTGNYVVGKINLNSTTASIAASHINLQGAVTISDLASDASTALTNAATTATNYISADSTGVRIANANPSTATTYQHLTSTNTEFVAGGNTVASFGSTVTLASDDGNHLVLDGDELEFLDQDDNRLFYIAPYDGDGIPEDSSVTLSTDSGWFVVDAGGLAYLRVGSDDIEMLVKKGNASQSALYASGSEVRVYQPLYADAGATVTYQLLAEGTQNTIALRANSAGNRGLYDVTSDEWILYRNYNTDKVVINAQLATLNAEEDSCTIESGATEYNANSCWSNGACCTVSLSVNLKSALANGGTVLIATAPNGYRPPHNVIGSVYVTGATAQVMAIMGTGGGITLNNRSGSSIPTSANIYVSFTFAP